MARRMELFFSVRKKEYKSCLHWGIVHIYLNIKNSVQQLQRKCSEHEQCKVSMGILNWQNPSEKFTSNITLLSHNIIHNTNFHTFTTRCKLLAGQLTHRAHHRNASGWKFDSQSVLPFSKIALQVYIITIHCHVIRWEGLR